MAVTAAAARRDLLEPALDARAHNLTQAQLIANPTPEVDSLLEHVHALGRDLPASQRRAHVHEALRLIRDLFNSNRAEGECEQTIAGAADQLAAALRAGTVERGWTVKRVARELRDPLAVLVNPIIRGDKRDDALRRVMRVVDQAPVELLTSVSAIARAARREVHRPAGGRLQAPRGPGMTRRRLSALLVAAAVVVDVAALLLITGARLPVAERELLLTGLFILGCFLGAVGVLVAWLWREAGRPKTATDEWCSQVDEDVDRRPDVTRLRRLRVVGALDEAGDLADLIEIDFTKGSKSA
jgi:hypothetical protein